MCVCVLFYLFSAKTSAWQLLSIQCIFVKEPDFKRERLFDTHPAETLACVIPCNFHHHPRREELE